jgi:hypothetical protein
LNFSSREENAITMNLNEQWTNRKQALLLKSNEIWKTNASNKRTLSSMHTRKGKGSSPRKVVLSRSAPTRNCYFYLLWNYIQSFIY